MPPSTAALHHAILTTLVDRGTTPTADELATRFGTDRPTVTAGLRALADDHGVVLHPHTPEVWVAVPMRRAWDNVLYTCSVMQLFTDGDAVDDWTARHGIARGDVQPVERVHAFAAAWYGRHLDPDWRKWTVDEAAELFVRFGLTGDTWDLGDTAGRF